jgi:hypothetical protein
MKIVNRALRFACAAGLLGAAAASASVIWDGSADKGTEVFGSLQPVNGKISIETDPEMGKVFLTLCHDNGGTKARCEVARFKGFQESNDGEYWFGWRHKWGPLPTKEGKWQVLEQIHLSGPGSEGGPVPLGLGAPGDGKMHLNLQDPGGKSTSVWDHPLPIGSWHSFVYHMKYAETMAAGWVELWYDGEPQTFVNGQKRINCAMAHANATSYWKWGVYRSGSGGPIGDSYAYLWRPRAGTSYEDVAPEGGTLSIGIGRKAGLRQMGTGAVTLGARIFDASGRALETIALKRPAHGVWLGPARRPD